MALKKSSLSLESSESDSEELPTFAFLKKEASSTKRRQPQREEKIVVAGNSDSEASCPPSPKLEDAPPVPDTADPVTQTEPVRVLSSGSDDEEELIPLAQRLPCKFLTRKLPSPEDSASPIKSVWEHQGTEGPSRDWKEQSFPKVPDVSFRDTSEKRSSNTRDPGGDQLCHQLPAFQATCPVRSGCLAAPKTNAEGLPLQKRTRRHQKVQRRGSPGCRPRGQASREESSKRPQERKAAAAPLNRLKARRPEECLQHIVVGLDPGPPGRGPHPVLGLPLLGCPLTAPFLSSIAELLQTEGGGQLLGALQSMGCRCVIEVQAVPRSIAWSRRAGPAEVAGFWLTSPPPPLSHPIRVLLLERMSVRETVENGWATPLKVT